MLPPLARLCKPVDTIPAKHLHQSTNKNRHPINVVRWTPEGRRLLTGSSSGEFTLWNGMSFNFETIMSAHDSAVRAAVWTHDDEFLVSADQDGIVKYWQKNLNNVKIIQAHDSPVRDLAFAPTDLKFITASDDASLKVFDFAAGVEEVTITGHGWDAKTVDWHPTKGLVVSGSKDHQVKLWDPRNGRCLTTLHGHKTTIAKCSFQPTGTHDLLATCARDTTARIFDLRMMRDILLLRGNEKDITTIRWHPLHASLITTGGNDGALYHYLLDEPNDPSGTPTLSPYDHADPSKAPTQNIWPAHKVHFAHDQAIWSLDWHPLGHIMASGSNDRLTRFWTRPRPGDSSYLQDPFHIGQEAARAAGYHRQRAGGRGAQAAEDMEDHQDDDEADGLVDQKMPAHQSLFPEMRPLPGLEVPNPAPQPPVQSGGQIAGQGQAALPGMPPVQPVPPYVGGIAPPPNLPPGMDMGRFQELVRSGQVPPPPQPGQYPVPPPPQFAGMPGLPQGGVVSGVAVSGGPQPPGLMGNVNNAGSVRKRGPLPSQQDSLKEEMRRGNYRKTH